MTVARNYIRGLLRTQLTYKIELFPKVVNDLQLLAIFAKNSILDVRLGFEYTSVQH